MPRITVDNREEGLDVERVPGPGIDNADAGRRDDGFGLMEVVVAMAIFTVFVMAALGLLVRTTDVTRDNGRRNVGTNLALQQVEAVRGLSALAVPDGRQVTTQVVDGIPYTVTQTSKYVSSGASGSACTGTSNTLAYKLVTVTVSWANMGNTKPVRSDTLKAVGIGNDVSDPNKGTAAVAVTDASGNPVPEVVVTLSGRSYTTGEDGCVVFTGLTPGTYTATANQAGYVGLLNAQTASLTNLGVSAGTIAHGSLFYDAAKSFNFVFDTPAGTFVPPLPIRFSNATITEYTLPSCTTPLTVGCVTAVPGTVKQIYPAVDTLKAGTCSPASASAVAIDLRDQAADGSTVTIPMGAPLVTVQNSANAYVNNKVVTFTGCSSTYTMTVTAGTGARIALPYGVWTANVPNRTSTLTAVTVSASNKQPTIALKVSS
jgi:prepilin-type N-terminal cleavage/methylation domain-containing protein